METVTAAEILHHTAAVTAPALRRRRSREAALAVLEAFRVDPRAARSDAAPAVFEGLFLPRLISALHPLNDRRAEILRSVSSRSLSRLSAEQASHLRDLERDYDEVLDHNCRDLAQYFMEVLEVDRQGRGRAVIESPPLVSRTNGKVNVFDGEEDEDRPQRIGIVGSINGRYNPVWTESEESVESFNDSSGTSHSDQTVPFHPQRVSPETLIPSQKKPGSIISTSNSDYEPVDPSSSDDNSVDYSSSSEENNRKMASFETRQRQTLKQEVEPSRPPDNKPMTMPVPPKDFVCPITSNVFDDPVTLETGQTYERRAIREWLERGNSTCPITRQKLPSTQLPKTNYVLKRLIGSWQEVHGPEPTSNSDGNEEEEQEDEQDEEFSNTKPELMRRAVSSLCAAENLAESESAVLRIERFWRETDNHPEEETLATLSRAPVVNGFVEILFNSVDPKVLGAAIFLLSELGSRDASVVQTLTRVDSDVEAVAALFRKGLAEAVVLIYLLRESVTDWAGLDLAGSLVDLIKRKDNCLTRMCVNPKTAAIVLLAQILEDSEVRFSGSAARAVVSGKAIESVVGVLGSGSAQERLAAVKILVNCVREDGKCRSDIADRAELDPLLESFVETGDRERFEIVRFLSELVKLNRRTFNEKILLKIRDNGSLSTMHNLLVYLQTAAEDQRPLVASLLLQLDLLSEPRKMSIFREEAIDSLIASLRNSNSPEIRVVAAETIVSLQGRFTASGKPLARAFLLKRAGLDNAYNSLVRIERLSNLSGEDDESSKEEEKAAENWERKTACVLAGHEFGLLFEALSEGLMSADSDLRSECFVAATWLVDKLKTLPDTGVLGAARVCLLKRFLSVFKSSRDAEDKALSLLALNSFIQDPEGLSQLTPYLKDILRGLRELKKSTPLATEMLSVLLQGQDSSAELWNHKQLVEVDCSENGEVLSVVCFKDKIFSGHSDGTIKVWTGKGSVLHLILEIRDHTKAVTSLVIVPEKERLFSGSLDRTIRVWSISDEAIDCTQVYDMKDQVQSLVVHGTICCFIPQGSGVKIQSWNGMYKLLNSSKSVKCLALSKGRLYCGCQDNSIQEIDLATETVSTIQGSSRKLLVKASPIQALQSHGGLLYAASSSLDSASVKILSAADYSMVGSLPSTLEVRAMAISSELVYLGCKKGTVEIWGREKQNKIDTLETGANCRVICLALGATEEVLVIGTSNGLIQAWGLS